MAERVQSAHRMIHKLLRFHIFSKSEHALATGFSYRIAQKQLSGLTRRAAVGQHSVAITDSCNVIPLSVDWLSRTRARILIPLCNQDTKRRTSSTRPMMLNSSRRCHHRSSRRSLEMTLGHATVHPIGSGAGKTNWESPHDQRSDANHITVMLNCSLIT